jgi:uncharacterized membrane protein YwzB
LMTYIKKKVNDQSSVREVRLLLGMNCVWWSLLQLLVENFEKKFKKTVKMNFFVL